MRYLMLIIDDDMPKAKGYGSIEEWFPGTFAIHEARTFAVRGHDGKAGQSAVARLTTVRYDAILADYNLMDGDVWFRSTYSTYGTAWRVMLPKKTAASTRTPTSSARPQAGTSRGRVC